VRNPTARREKTKTEKEKESRIGEKRAPSTRDPRAPAAGDRRRRGCDALPLRRRQRGGPRTFVRGLPPRDPVPVAPSPSSLPAPAPAPSPRGGADSPTCGFSGALGTASPLRSSGESRTPCAALPGSTADVVELGHRMEPPVDPRGCSSGFFFLKEHEQKSPSDYETPEIRLSVFH
jgi:hypothetical protein